MSATESLNLVQSGQPAAPRWGGLGRKLLALLGWIAAFIAGAAVFSLAYTQSVLYEGNQNTKFLHGLAEAGQGMLQDDWLAKTVDPLPVFSALVDVTARVDANLFYIYYAVLMGIYAFTLSAIVVKLFPIETSTIRQWSYRLLIYTGLVVTHSRWLILIAQRRFDINLEFLQFGLAGQYLLGEEFQNSSFGVLLLLSIYLFVEKKTVWAILSLGAACLLHSAYLFSAAWMTAAYLIICFIDNYRANTSTGRLNPEILLRSARQPLVLGFVALAMVAPVVWYNQSYLPSSTPEASQRAMEILVVERIPHHTLPAVFVDGYTYAQIALMLAGLLLAGIAPEGGRRLFTVMAFLFGGGAAFSFIQIITNSYSLGMLGPWRVSVLLVPLSTALVIGAAAYFILEKLQIKRIPFQWVVLPVCAYLLFVVVDRGNDIQAKNNTSFRVKRMELVMDYVSRTAQRGDVYLIPPKEPDFDDFRIFTGAPIFVNWKSHPYKDSEVLEWYRRVQSADRFYDAPPGERCQPLLDLLEEYYVSHVVLKGKEVVLPCEFTQEEFRSVKYTVFKVLFDKLPDGVESAP